jgi:hypothetical protein
MLYENGPMSLLGELLIETCVPSLRPTALERLSRPLR